MSIGGDESTQKHSSVLKNQSQHPRQHFQSGDKAHPRYKSVLSRTLPSGCNKEADSQFFRGFVLYDAPGFVLPVGLQLTLFVTKSLQLGYSPRTILVLMV